MPGVAGSDLVIVRHSSWAHLGYLKVGCQLVDRDHRDAPTQGEALHGRSIQHLAIRRHYLADDRHGGKPRGTAQCQ